VVQVVDHIYVRMSGWLSAQMRMIGRQFRMLMRNDVGILNRPKSEKKTVVGRV